MKNIVLILILFASLAFHSNASAQAVILKTDTVSVNCASTDTIFVPVRVRNFNGVGSFQFTLSWDTTRLDYLYNTNLNPAFTGFGVNFGLDNTTFINQSPAKLTFAWTKVGGGSVPDNSIVFTLAFKRIGGPYASVQFVNNPIIIEVTDKDGNNLDVQTSSGGVKPIDDKNPTITCPANVVDSSSFPLAINNIAPTSVSDNCSNPTVGWKSSGATTSNNPNDPDASGAVFNFGLTTVTYTATDVGGNTATCSFTVDLAASTTGDTLTVIAQSGASSCGQTYSLNITALNFDSLGSLQFSLGWDTAVVKFLNASNFNPALNLSANNFGIVQTIGGKISFNWTTNQLSGTTLPQGAVLFTLNFTVNGTSGGASPILFIDSPAVREAYTSATMVPEEIPAIWVGGSVTVQDLTGPTLICPPSMQVTAPIGTTSVIVNNLQPLSLSDNCSGLVSLSYLQSGSTTGSGNGNANGSYYAGTTVVRYQATDAAGNVSSCTFQVVIDAGTPVTLLLDSLTTDCQGVGNEITYNISVKDFNDIVGLQFSITWNPAVLQFNAVANEYPGLGLTPGNFNGFSNVGTGLLQFLGGNAITGWPMLADGDVFFSIKFTVLNPNATSTLAFVGPFDAANSALDAVPVSTVNGYFKSEDLSAPTIVCPVNILQDAATGTCQATVNIPFPQVDDPCSGVQSIVKDPVSNVFTSGTTVVTFTATDNVNNSSTCSMTVTINASTVPVISNCPADITVIAPGNDCVAIVGWQSPNAIDACGNVLVPIPNQAPNTPFNVGQTPVYYIASDLNGNADTCTFQVLVRDTVAPEVNCPGSFTLQLGPTQCCALGGYQLPTVTDNCDTAVDLVGDHTPSENYCVGVTTVNYTAADDFGNTATCSFVISVPDEIAPAVVICPSDIEVDSDPDACGANVNWIEPAFDDLCDNNPLTISKSNDSGDFFDVGTYLVEYYASDISNNVGVCQFNVTVIDVIPPELGACPDDIFIDLPIDSCTSVVSWTPPTASDNCTAVTLDGTYPPNTVFTSGTTLVTYTATDDVGNTISCAFNVTLTDKIAPKLTNCPPDFVLTNVDPCNAVPNWLVFPGATDNCSVVTIDSSTYRPGDAFPVGETIVVILATDASGNSDTCSFMVKVIGIPPGFDNVPANIALNGCAQTVTWSPPIPVGICDLDSLRSNYQPGDLFQNGITVVTYLAFHANGDTTITSFTVTVTDTDKPTITCPTGPIVVNVGGVILSDPSIFLTATDTVSTCDGAKLSFALPTAVDLCGAVSVVQTLGLSSGMRFPVGLDTVQFVATDASGNTSVCPLVIDIRPLEDLRPSSSPNPICKGTTNVVITLADLQDATYYWTGPNNKDTLQVNNYNVVIGQENNVYSVFADVNGCRTKSDTIRLTLVEKPDAVNDTIYVQPGQADTFNILNNDFLTFGDPGAVKWQPQPITGLDSIGNGIFVYNPGTNGQPVTFFYQLCSALCEDLCDAQMATVFVLFKDENCNFIPNVFTPNGDSNHDKFEIPCIGLIEGKNSLVVYNQWGDKVYEAVSYDNSWDGTLNGKGKPLPDGVYFYIFEPSSGSAKKGFVEIIR